MRVPFLPGHYHNSIEAGRNDREPCLRSGISHLTGTIEPGKMADVLVVDGDPLAEPGVLQDKVLGVFKEGKQVIATGVLDRLIV